MTRQEPIRSAQAGSYMRYRCTSGVERRQMTAVTPQGCVGVHAMPGSWECVAWKARGGYGSQGNGRGRENSARERIWFSPACLDSKQQSLFGGSSADNSGKQRTDAELEQGTNSI